MSWLGEVTRDEPITRFCVVGSQIKEKNRLNHSVIWPDENEEYITSVYRIENLNNTEVWDLGDTNVNNPVLARLDVSANTIFNFKLDFDPDDTPPRHANIINWPKDRSEYRSVAQQITANSKHIMR